MKKLKQVLSVFLSFVMVATLVPMSVINTSADVSTQETEKVQSVGEDSDVTQGAGDVVEIDDIEVLFETLAKDGDVHIVLTDDLYHTTEYLSSIGCGDYNEKNKGMLKAITHVQCTLGVGNKTIDLNGYNIKFTNNVNCNNFSFYDKQYYNNLTMFLIPEGAKLTINDDEDNSGIINYRGFMCGTTLRNLKPKRNFCAIVARDVFKVQSGGELVINGGHIVAGDSKKQWIVNGANIGDRQGLTDDVERYDGNARQQIYGSAVVVNGGKVTINGGVFEGRGGKRIPKYSVSGDVGNIMGDGDDVYRTEYYYINSVITNQDAKGAVQIIREGSDVTINAGKFEGRGGASVIAINNGDAYDYGYSYKYRLRVNGGTFDTYVIGKERLPDHVDGIAFAGINWQFYDQHVDKWGKCRAVRNGKRGDLGVPAVDGYGDKVINADATVTLDGEYMSTDTDFSGISNGKTLKIGSHQGYLSAKNNVKIHFREELEGNDLNEDEDNITIEPGYTGYIITNPDEYRYYTDGDSTVLCTWQVRQSGRLGWKDIVTTFDGNEINYVTDYLLLDATYTLEDGSTIRFNELEDGSAIDIRCVARESLSGYEAVSYHAGTFTLYVENEEKTEIEEVNVLMSTSTGSLGEQNQLTDGAVFEDIEVSTQDTGYTIDKEYGVKWTNIVTGKDVDPSENVVLGDIYYYTVRLIPNSHFEFTANTVVNKQKGTGLIGFTPDKNGSYYLRVAVYTDVPNYTTIDGININFEGDYWDSDNKKLVEGETLEDPVTNDPRFIITDVLWSRMGSDATESEETVGDPGFYTVTLTLELNPVYGNLYIFNPTADVYIGGLTGSVVNVSYYNKKMVVTSRLLQVPCNHSKYTYEYDMMYHWKVCSICQCVFDKNRHSYKTKTSTDYEKTTECAECGAQYYSDTSLGILIEKIVVKTDPLVVGKQLGKPYLDMANLSLVNITNYQWKSVEAGGNYKDAILESDTSEIVENRDYYLDVTVTAKTKRFVNETSILNGYYMGRMGSTVVDADNNTLTAVLNAPANGIVCKEASARATLPSVKVGMTLEQVAKSAAYSSKTCFSTSLVISKDGNVIATVSVNKFTGATFKTGDKNEEIEKGSDYVIYYLAGGIGEYVSEKDLTIDDNGATSYEVVTGPSMVGITATYVTDASCIKKVEVTGVSEPAGGSEITSNSTVEDDAHYSVQQLGWGETGTFKCGESYTVSIILNADEGYYFKNSGSTPLIASVNGKEAKVISIGDTEKGISVMKIECTFDAAGHSLMDAVEENRVESTCAKEGSYDSVIYCDECNQVVESNVVIIPKKEHTYVKKNTVPATCTEYGYTVYECSECNDSAINHRYEDDFVDPLSHNYVDGVCSKCGTKKTGDRPGNIVMKSVTQTLEGVSVKWNLDDNADSYAVFRRVGTYWYLIEENITGSQFLDTTAVAGTTYKYAVKGYNKEGGSYTLSDNSMEISLGACPFVKLVPDATSIDVQWSAIQGATKYRVFTYDGSFHKVADTTKTSYTISNLETGVEYGVIVLAYVNGKWTSYSMSDVKYAKTTYRVSTEVKAGDKRLYVNWAPIEGATNYRVFTQSNGKYTKQGDTKETTYTIKGLDNGYSYGVIVLAYVDGKWSGHPDEFLIFAAPQALDVNVVATAGNSKVELKWDAIEDATAYRVFYMNCNDTYKVWTLYDDVETNYTTVTNLINNKTYGFVVQAFIDNSWATFEESYVKYATPVNYVTKPEPVLTAGDQKIEVEWEPASAASIYRVFTYDGSFHKIGDTNKPYYTITGLTNGKKYGVVVLAYINGKWTSYTAKDIKYATPYKLVDMAELELTAGDTQITATWEAVTNATKYRVFKYLNGKFTKVGDTVDTTYTVKELENGVEYGVIVLSYVNGKWTSYDIDKDVYYATPYDSTKPFVTAVAGNKSIKATWTKVEGAIKYRVFTYDGAFHKITDTTGTSYTVTGLTNGKSIGVIVLAYVNGKWTSYTTDDIKYATPTA